MRRRSLTEPDLPPQINIVPMIDVIFAILTFFIMSTLFLARLEALTVNLPQAKTAKQQPSSRVAVTLTQDGELYLNKSPVQVENLSKAVTELIKPQQDLVVVLNADGAVTHDRVVAVMDQIRQVKGAKLAISARQSRRQDMN